MDRRQQKSRAAIFAAFIKLLDKKDFSAITVQEIIDCANVGRATFYAHFETKDYLLKELCEELFGHVFGLREGHFNCGRFEGYWEHLLYHLKNNDDNVLRLLSSKNNELFWHYFREGLRNIVEQSIDTDALSLKAGVPESYLVNYIAGVFTETLEWWISDKCRESEQRVAEYFYTVIENGVSIKGA